MADTTFASGTVIQSPWLNDVNNYVYHGTPPGTLPSSANVSFLQAGTGAVVSTVQAKLRESVSVKDFGTVGDGVTDDTSAIQATLNSGALKIIFPPGTYIFSRLTIPNNVSLFGESATLKMLANSNAGVGGNFAVTHASSPASGISIAGLTFDGNKANQQNSGANNFSVYFTNGLTFTNATNITLRNLTFHDWPAEGLSFRGTSNSTVQGIVAYNNATVGTRFGSSTQPNKYNTVSDIISYNNSSVANTGYDGFFIEQNQFCSFTNLNAYYQAALLYEGGTGIKLVNVTDCQFSGITANYCQWQGIHLNASSRNSFSGVVANYNGTVGVAGSGHGIHLDGGSTYNTFTAVESNYNGSASTGVGYGVYHFEDSNTYNSFDNCIISNNYTVGFEIRGNGTRLVNSTLSANPTQVSFTKYAGTDPSGCTVTGNAIIGGTTDFGFTTTTLTIIKGNSQIGNNQSSAATKVDVPLTVGGTGAAFQNSWVNQGAGYAVASYYKDAAGFVHLQGLIQTGLVGTVIFTLPAGFRPTSANTYYATGYSVFSSIAIDSVGNVICSVKGTTSVALDGISFLAVN